MIRQISYNGALVALWISSSDIPEGTHPITDSSWPLQALMMSRKRGHVFAKHTHAKNQRSTGLLSETIVVTKGKVLVTVTTREGVEVEKCEVSSGECLLLVNGGYMIEVLDDAAFYEFKNGPHLDDKVLL